MLEKPLLGSADLHPTDNVCALRRPRCETSAAQSPARPHSDPRALLPPVPPRRRRPLPCPRHLPRPLRRAGPEWPWPLRERPLAPRAAHCSRHQHPRGGASSFPGDSRARPRASLLTMPGG
ncbi:hypothetical protein HJG60_011840 [Phyllostomus discolor]|uniref:Uncharacterized protein n=1 Tax=Phyllostomus discolor TaxID=89673 RepID=A0A833ZLM3_9CHIR|nr:hypothetical protein HJG60_011840 [Phyllostomus discolor]